MNFIFLFFVELIFLFFVSRTLTRLLSQFLLRVTKSSDITIQILSFLFLPGVIIHELSHMLIAGILFVGVGEIEFVPKIIKDGKSEGVKLGSVAIAKTDPLRRVIIGIAPVFLGLAFILAISYFTINDKLFIHIFGQLIVGEIIIKIILFYLLFTVTNTMFSSKKDMEGTIEFLLTILLIGLILYSVGVRIPLDFLTTGLLSKESLGFVKQQNMFLLIPLAIDVVIVGLIKAVE